MKYTKEQRLDIGRRIYDGEISRYEAAEEYVINEQTARNYMRMYRDANQLPPKQGRRSICAPSFKKAPAELDELKAMTKEELIQELIKAKITEARLKKGYEVKGDGYEEILFFVFDNLWLDGFLPSGLSSAAEIKSC